MEPSKEFGAWLRHQRTEVFGWKQIELANRVACSETMIRKIEKGERRPAKELAERLIHGLGIDAGRVPAYVAWARGLAGHPDAGGIKLSEGVQQVHVLVPLDAVASFGPEEPMIVQLTEPHMGRTQWVSVPLSVIATFGLQPPCQGEACNGLDPEVSGCSRGSVTVDGHEIHDPETSVLLATLELRYSRPCQTNWVRITRFSRDVLRIEAYLRDAEGAIIETTRVTVTPPQVYGYGAMHYAPTGSVLVQACAVVEGLDEVRTNLN